MSVGEHRASALAWAALLASLLGAAGACTGGSHDDDDDTPSLRGIVGPISDFPRPDAGFNLPSTGAGSSDAFADAGLSGGGIVNAPGDAGAAAPPDRADAGSSGEFDDSGSDGGAADAGEDAGDDAGADAGTDAATCLLLCP